MRQRRRILGAGPPPGGDGAWSASAPRDSSNRTAAVGLPRTRWRRKPSCARFSPPYSPVWRPSHAWLPDPLPRPCRLRRPPPSRLVGASVPRGHRAARDLRLTGPRPDERSQHVTRCTAHGKSKRFSARNLAVSHRRRPTSRRRWPVEKHVETWAYDDCGNGGASADAAVVREWVNYAEANCGPGGDAKALSDCHSGATAFCDVIQYLDTDWIYQSGSPPWQPFNAAASESWYQHAPGSTTMRIASSGYGGGYLINQSNPEVRSFFQSYVRAHYGADDGLMMDDQSASLSSQLYYATCGCGSSEEVSSTPALQTAHESMSAAMTRSDGLPYLQIDNGLPPNPYLSQGFRMLDPATGWRASSARERRSTTGRWIRSTRRCWIRSPTSPTIPAASSCRCHTAPRARRISSGVVGCRKPRSCSDTAPAISSTGPISSRAAVTWRCGRRRGCTRPARCNRWERRAVAAAWPERAPCARPAVTTTCGRHRGVYRREFRACYDQGVQFGPCAAIVNTTASPITIRSAWLTQSYGHQITFSGGDSQSGGAVNLTGSLFVPNSTTVGAQDATLLAP